MDLTNYLLCFYIIIGVFFVVFYIPISNFFYKLTLLFTNKLRLDNMFLYKIDKTNNDIIYKLARKFTLMLGILIILLTLGFCYY